MKLSTNQIKKFPKMLVVDCEMVLFEDGTEALVRVCAVGHNLQVLFEFVFKFLCSMT